MPDRGRLHRVALGGCLAAILLASLSLGHAQEPPAQSEAPQAAPDQQQPSQPAPAAIPSAQEQEASPKQQTLCDKAEDGPQSDLCEQWRMANAAEQQVDWLRRQFSASLWEIGALAFTLLATAAAAIAAFIAARAANRAVKVTVDTAERQLRAYLLPEKVSFIDPDDTRLAVQVAFKNTGQTPAAKVRHTTHCGVGTMDTAEERFELNEIPDRSAGSVGPGQVISSLFRQPDGNDFVLHSAAIFDDKAVFYVWGKVIYTDAFDQEQVTCFRFRYSPIQDSFVVCHRGNDAT